MGMLQNNKIMKIFKFVKKLFQNFVNSMLTKEVLRDLGTISIIILFILATVYIFGFVAYLFGWFSTANSIFDRGGLLILVCAIIAYLTSILFLIGKGICKVFNYFRKVWKEL